VAVWVNNEKVFLKAGASEKNPRLMQLNLPVQLDPGPNIITVIAREGQSNSTYTSVAVTLPGGLDSKEQDEIFAEKLDLD
jgi:hypothetical protein